MKLPLYIRIENFEDVQETVKVLQKRLDTARSTLSRVIEIHKDEEAKIQEWQANLDEVKQRIEHIDEELGVR